jgi:hypothetical protein
MHMEYATTKIVERCSAEINLKVLAVEEEQLVLNQQVEQNKQQLEDYMLLQAMNDELTVQLMAMPILQWEKHEMQAALTVAKHKDAKERTQKGKYKQ